MKIIYMGTPEFAVSPLEKLYKSEHNVLGVVCQPDRKAGRGKKMMFPPVKEKALEYNIDIFQPEKIRGNEDFLEEIGRLDPDIIVVAAYGKILPKDILELPKFGCINIHASLLPKLRGAAPIQTAILNGDDLTGITIMKMAEGLDTGDIIATKEVPIESMAYTELSKKLSEIGGDLLIDVLDSIEESGEITAAPQNEKEATYAPMIEKADGRIDFTDQSVSEIQRMIRAYEQWPGVYTYLNDEIIKLKSVSEKKDCEENKYCEFDFGTVISTDKEGIYVRVRDGIMQIRELQPQGKKTMDAASYLRGHNLEPGTILG